jgi:hypothetical protein
MCKAEIGWVKPSYFFILYLGMAKEYKYRMLVYPNITKDYAEIRKDSYMVLIPSLLKTISKICESVHITILNPIYLEEFDRRTKSDAKIYPNVKQVIYNQRFSSANSKMRSSFFFDGGVFEDVLDFKRHDYDIVYSHLPEHTLQLSNILEVRTHSVPKIVGYSHWFETDNTSAKKMLLQNYIGLLEMEVCGVNSQWLKDKVMRDAKKTFNDKIMKRLDEIIQVHQLGVEDYDFSSVKHKGKKIIVFNHRGQEYMGWKFFCKAMDKLWKKRKDFKVQTFQREANAVKKPWTEYQSPLDVDRKTYFETLKQAYIGVGCFTGYSGGGSWSISITDLLSLNVPCVLPNAMCYPQMVGEKYPLFYKWKSEDDFINVIEQTLDNPKLYQKAQKHIQPIVRKMKWLPSVKKWMDWDELFNPNTFKMVGDSPRYKDVLKIIKKHKIVQKPTIIAELGNWGVSRKFGKYRHRLRLDKRIKFLEDGYEWVG